MKTLHLNVFRKWFDKIKSGEKLEDYRGYNEYWIPRLIDKKTGKKKQFDEINIKNGFKRQNGNPAPIMKFKHKDTTIITDFHPETNLYGRLFKIIFGERIL